MRRIVLVIGCFAAASAHADNASVHVTANGDVATSDNVFSSNDNRQGDIFFQVRPGFLFAYDAPRMIHELTADVEFLEYIAHSDKPSVTFHGGWRGFFLPGPRSELTLNADGSTGQLNTLNSNTSPDQTGVMVIPAGSSDFREANAAELFSWLAGKDTRFSQSLFARYSFLDDNIHPDPGGPSTTIGVAEVGGTLGLSHTFNHDDVGVEAGGSYLRMERIAPMSAAMGSRLDRQTNPRGSLVWRHDLDKHWSTNVDAGVVYVHPVGTDPYNPTDVRRSAPFPIFGGLVAYTEVWGRATLTARRSVTPNQFIAENTVTDSLIAQVAMPLEYFDKTMRYRAPKIVGLASLGIERSQLINPDLGALDGEFKVGRLDLGVAWTPHPGVSYGLRYQFVYQTASDPTALMFSPSYWANTFYFTFALRYPDRVAAKVPRRGTSVRADRKDLAPIGAEPVIPDPTEQLPQGDDEGGGDDGDR